MKIIGVTGISGAGKSTVSKRICELINARYINADIIAKALSKKGEKYYEEIVKEFGNEILNDDLEINRKKLADIIFYDKIKKEKINSLTYKYVVPKIIEEAKKKTKCEITVIDVPLLFESGLDKICDKTIGVIAKKETCIKRIIERDGISEEMALARINSQKGEEFFKANCNYCVFNDEENSRDRQIEKIFAYIT